METTGDIVEIARKISSERGLTFVEEVGAGAFKRTFKVLNESAHPRALKVYKSPGTSPRASREVDAMLRCSHPGIVGFELIETRVERGIEYLYTIEEFLSGGTLATRIGFGRLPTAEVFRLGESLIGAVSHIAALELVHRDIKPDNIMFRTPGGDGVLVDFGLVRDLTQSSLTQTWLPQGPGTPFYAAPEQLNNEKSMIGWRADQFSLGVALSISAHGRHPYDSGDVAPAHIVDLVARRSGPSEDFVAWAEKVGLGALRKMVAPWPVQRFRTPGQLAHAWKQGRSA